MKKAVIIIIVIVVLAAAGVGAYFYFANSNYQLYSKAFDKTFKTNSLELNTSVKAKAADGTSISSTGNFKIKDMNTTPQFINTITVSDGTSVQFSDGITVYTDDGRNKSKMTIGEDPSHRHFDKSDGGGQAENSLENYINTYSSLLDASKFKQINSLEPVAEKYVDKIETESVSGGKRFIVTLLPAAVNDLFDTFVSENVPEDTSPAVSLNSIKYTATVVSDYVSEITFSINMDVTMPNSGGPQNIVVDLTITPVNPGKPVTFDLPSTAGF